MSEKLCGEACSEFCRERVYNTCLSRLGSRNSFSCHHLRHGRLVLYEHGHLEGVPRSHLVSKQQTRLRLPGACVMKARRA